MWEQLPTRKRCKRIAAAVGEVCDRSELLIDACRSDQRIDPVETITGELIPLCAALRFIGRHGPSILSSQRVGVLGRPAWLWGLRSVVQRVPWGRVLILGTWNYPLLLSGVQVAQALAAGNRVQLKPAAGTELASELLVEAFREVGVSQRSLQLLDSSTEAATSAIQSGTDLIVLTGSAETGQAVLAAASETLSATIMELSGCDAVIAMEGCDQNRLAMAIEFGLRFNSSATCIAPRRLIVTTKNKDSILHCLQARITEFPELVVHPAARQQAADRIEAALVNGAKDRLQRYDSVRLRNEGRMFPLLLELVDASDPIASADVFAPVICMITAQNLDESIQIVNRCPYRLAVSLFGSARLAEQAAEQLDVGQVTINDLIVPTADPRLPFGGRGNSGFGVTRGREGLLAMTTPRTISTRRGSVLPHLRRRSDSDEDLLHGAMHWLYGGTLSKRIAGLRRMVRPRKRS